MRRRQTVHRWGTTSRLRFTSGIDGFKSLEPGSCWRTVVPFTRGF